ncbi:hypothetical protein Droror1_Dr00001657 [Drosera rotundifolia]
MPYNPRIKRFCKVNEVDKACELVQEMLSKGASPDMDTYNTILVMLYKQQRLDEAEQLQMQLLNSRSVYVEAQCISKELEDMIPWVLSFTKLLIQPCTEGCL